jgi:FAD/FMN-containing dehydrogenase
VVGSGILAAALDVLDAETLDCGRASFPGGVPEGAAFVLLAEADGSREEAERTQAELVEAAGDGALGVYAPREREGVDAFWRWRSGLAFAVLARRGGVVAEDFVVPLDRVREAMEETVRIGRRHGLVAVSFGHAGDGNLHSGFLVSPDDPDELRRVELAVEELLELTVRLGGSVSGEHGLGLIKRGRLARQWSPRALDLHEQIKQVFDPKNLLNPGKKLARPLPGARKLIATRS